MHISGEINSSVMINVGLFDVAQLFGLKIQEDYEISRGIHSERPTELYSLAEAIRSLLNSAGTMLRNLHCEDWAEFWLGSAAAAASKARMQEIDPATNAPVRPKAQDAVARLVRHFTGLQDAYILPVKKAQEQKEQEGAEAESKQTDAGASASATPAAAAAASAPSDAAATPAAAAAEPAAAASAGVAASSASSSSSSSSPSAAAAATSCAVGDHRIVYLLKKAQLMVADLYLRFGVSRSRLLLRSPARHARRHLCAEEIARSPDVLTGATHLCVVACLIDLRACVHVVCQDEADSPFNFSDINDLTVFSDNVLPAVLRASGVLQYSDELGELVDSNTKITDREQEASIRAGAVVACEQIVAQYNAKNATAEDPTPINAMALDYHLWLAGKNPQFRQLARHATHSIYY